MSKGASNHCHCLTGDLHTTALVPQVQAVMDVGILREATMLLHKFYIFVC